MTIGEHHLKQFGVTLIAVMAVLAVSITPVQADDAKKLYNEAMAQASQGKYDDAAESLRKAIAIRPKFAEAHHLLGIVYANGQRKPPEAVESFKKAIELNPNFAEAFYNLGLVYQGQAKLGDAEQALQHALAIHPKYEEALLALGQLYERQQSTNEETDDHLRFRQGKLE